MTGLAFDGFRRLRGHTYYAEGLSQDSVVIDAGSHKFEFANQVRAIHCSNVIAIEPNAELINFEQIPRGVHFIHAALCSSDHRRALWISDNSEASSVAYRAGNDQIQVSAETLENILNDLELETIDLLKMDIEGAEYDVILNGNPEVFKHVRQISVEFHDFLPEFKKQSLTKQCVERLASLGFVGYKCSPRTNGDYLFLNREFFDIGRLENFLLFKFLFFRGKLTRH